MSSNTNSKNKAMTWQALCLMAYTVVWGFGNTVNGFANQGLKVVVSWMILFLFYFIPYTLMVGKWARPLKMVLAVSAPGSKKP
ncbi:hypothetical protein M5E89_13365 [Acidaminococcus intestini]|nr:hypothetical protein M5E89_13365 [Acidaminococcus intestini]